MQPNNNGVGAGAPVSAAAPKEDIVFRDKPRKNTGMTIGMIVLALLAAGGIGFGVWAMLDKNQEVDTLNNQISELSTKKCISEDVPESVEKEPEESSADYIYVGEWGLKIKIPDDLTVTGYRYNMLDGYTSIGISGNTKNGQYFPGFADLIKTNSPLGAVSRYAKGTEMPLASTPSLVFSDEQYDYYYYHPQAVISEEDDEQKWEVESTSAIEQMLNNKDNYSSI